MKRFFCLLVVAVFFFSSCAVTTHFMHQASKSAFNSPDLHHAYVGISIYNPTTDKFLFQQNGDKYFTPASNTKIYTLYTGMSFLGDSLTGIKYKISNDTLYIQGTGDPSLFHPDYKDQAVVNFLQQQYDSTIVFTNPVDENKVYGPGWAWDDYSEEYQPERSAMPIYGNVARFSMNYGNLQVTPAYFQIDSLLLKDTSLQTSSFYLHREQDQNLFHYNAELMNDSDFQEVPFRVYDGRTTAKLLADTLGKKVLYDSALVEGPWQALKNIPSDSLYQHMMYRSDNFFAEQVLQMCSDQLFDTINTSRMIHYMLENKLTDLPDSPRWVDGSGLSRYDLFTPRDMVKVLTHLYQDFPKERLYNIFPTGGKGTLRSLYHNMAGSIFAKTGTLNNNSALSGYLITKKGNTYIFSIMVNHYVCSSQIVRVAMEKFLVNIWRNY